MNRTLLRGLVGICALAALGMVVFLAQLGAAALLVYVGSVLPGRLAGALVGIAAAIAVGILILADRDDPEPPAWVNQGRQR